MLKQSIATYLGIAFLILIIVAFVTLARKKEGSLKKAIIEFFLAIISALFSLYLQYGIDYIPKFLSSNEDTMSHINKDNSDYTATNELNEKAAHSHQAFITKKENNVDPDCYNKGSYESVIYCNCGEELSRTTISLEPLGHNYKELITKPTCSEQGFTTFSCSRCNDTYVGNYVAALEHNYEEGICTQCGYSDPNYVKIYDSKEIMKILSESIVSNTGGYSQYLGTDSISVLAEDKYNCFLINTAVSYNLFSHNIREIVFNISGLDEIGVLNLEIGGHTGSKGSVIIEFFVDKQFDSSPDYTYELDTTFTPILASINIENATLLGIRVTNCANNENGVVFFNFSKGPN